MVAIRNRDRFRIKNFHLNHMNSEQSIAIPPAQLKEHHLYRTSGGTAGTLLRLADITLDLKRRDLRGVHFTRCTFTRLYECDLRGATMEVCVYSCQPVRCLVGSDPGPPPTARPLGTDPITLHQLREHHRYRRSDGAVGTLLRVTDATLALRKRDLRGVHFERCTFAKLYECNLVGALLTDCAIVTPPVRCRMPHAPTLPIARRRHIVPTEQLDTTGLAPAIMMVAPSYRDHIFAEHYVDSRFVDADLSGATLYATRCTFVRCNMDNLKGELIDCTIKHENIPEPN